MAYAITVFYLLVGILWVENAFDWKYMPYYQYVYHGLFWPVSVIVYFIGRWK